MWSFGCIVAGMVFNRLPFFRAHGNDDQLRVIVNVLGTTELHRYIQKYDLHVNETLIASLGNCRRRDWSEFASGIDATHICTELFDLLDNLLIYDHQKRLTAKECMQHPYFREVRERLMGESVPKSIEQRENRVGINSLADPKELLENLRSLKRGLEERAKAEIANGEYQLVSTICETLKVSEPGGCEIRCLPNMLPIWRRTRQKKQLKKLGAFGTFMSSGNLMIKWIVELFVQ